MLGGEFYPKATADAMHLRLVKAPAAPSLREGGLNRLGWRSVKNLQNCAKDFPNITM